MARSASDAAKCRSASSSNNRTRRSVCKLVTSQPDYQEIGAPADIRARPRRCDEPKRNIVMNYEAADRVLSISFLREPEEHANAILEADRRMTTAPDEGGRATGRALGAAVGFAAAVGIIMELHRRFILPLILEPSDIPPLGTAVLELLPFFLLVVALFATLYVRASRRRRHGLTSRLRPGVFVDVDIFSKGIAVSADQSRFEVDWSGVRDVVAVPNGMEIECEAAVIFIPARAFANRAAFSEAGKEIRNVWREALKRDHDGKMVAAGLD
jgi:hypothetical protein